MGNRRMTVHRPAGRWTLAFASAIGTSHLKSASPCQDAALCEVVEDMRGNDILLAAASDGAGSAQQSHEGSHFACRYFREWFAGWLLHHELAELDRNAVTEWIGRLQLQMELSAEDEGLKIRDYACTFLGALIGNGKATFLQVGDGAIVVAGRSSTAIFRHIFWPQRGEYENTTNFITEDTAIERLDFQVLDDDIDEVALFTDGIQALVLHYASQTAHSPFFERQLRLLRGEPQTGLSERVSLELAEYLNSERINERTDDDKTLVLASRRAADAVSPHAQESAS
jgi:hypothetical protein